MRKLLLLVDDAEPVALDLPDLATVRIGRAEPGGAPAGALRRDANGAFEIRVASAAVSTEHAELELAEDGATVRDLGSTNGTFLQLSPGQRRRCTGRFLLGPHVTVELHHAALPASEEVDATSPEELRRHVAAVLGPSVASVRLVRSLPKAAGSPRTVLPLVGDQTLVVEWPGATLDFSALRWLRSVVNRFNLQERDERGHWTFTAQSPARRAALSLSKRAAPFEASVLLLGASGSGKGVLARDIHDHSLRAGGAFVRLNCGAIPQELFESQMFGHAQGAFTGATRPSTGLVEQADGGTLFLDEVGELSLLAQAKLLQFLDSGEYYPVGSSRLRRADIRIITATNRDLVDMLTRSFREDLFHRIAEVTISIPDPASEDLRAAVPGLLAEVAAKNRTTVKTEEAERLADLAGKRTYNGHFRQLRASLGRYLFLRDPRRSIDDTWREVVEGTVHSAEVGPDVQAPTAEHLTHFVRSMENLLRLQLARESSSVADLARRLRRTPATLYTWLARMGISPREIGDTEAIRKAIEAEVGSLAPHSPCIEQLFKV